MIHFIEINTFLFFIEYFLGIIILFILLTYILIINNIFDLLLNKAISNCIILFFLLIFLLILNDPIFFLIDLKFNNFFYINNLIIFDLFSAPIKLVLTFICCAFFLIITDLINDYNFNHLEFITIILINILGLFLLCSSFDLLLIFISIELTGFSSYFLVSFKKNSYSIECSLKYLIINILSSILFLLGILGFYYFTGSIELLKIQLIFINSEVIYSTIMVNFCKIKTIYYYNYYSIYLKVFYVKFWLLEYLLFNNFFLTLNKLAIELGLILITTSLFIKLGVPPYHFWIIEIYEKSNSIITFFLLILPKLSFFIILIRFTIFLFNFNILLFYLIFIGICSVFVGSIVNLNEKNIKSILIYSSINHIGYIILGYTTGSLFSLNAFFSYLFIYLLSNLIVWFIILNLKRKKFSKKFYCNNIIDYILLNKSNKLLSFSFLLVLFSFSGIPPFIGFFIKYNIFLSTLKTEYFLITLISAICSSVSVFYYIRLIKVLYFENINFGNLYQPLLSFNIFLVYFFSFTLLFLFINPKLFYLIIYKFIFFNYFY